MGELSAAAAEPAWVELLSRQREVIARQRLQAAALTIGRAYDNDLVLDDPHVAPRHLRLERGADGVWCAEDLGSVNGLYVDGGRTRQARVALAGDTTLRIGTTLLRVRSAREPVPAERPLRQARPRWPFALACLALVFALALGDLWLGETAEPKAIRYLSPLLSLAALVAFWTSAWSVLSRLFGGHAQFGRHLAIAGAGLLLYSLYDKAAELAAFAFAWSALAASAYVGAWLALAAVTFAHLRVLGPRHWPLKALGVLALAALGITMQSLRLAEWRSTYGQPTILRRLEPPSLRLVGAPDAAAFLAGASLLKTSVDQARGEEPAGDDDGAPEDE